MGNGVVTGAAGGFALACAMSLFSKHYSHPDETVTRMATDYYLAGWLRPDMNSSMVSGTFSMWGHNRLAESSLYYFLAGKVGWLFREFFYIPTYYRMFNLLLLGNAAFAGKGEKNISGRLSHFA